MAIERTSPRVRGNNAQASPDFNDQTRDPICPGIPPASIDRDPVCVLGPATLPAAVFGQEREVVVNNFDPEMAIVLDGRACDRGRMAAASNGNRATACDRIVPTVDPVIAGPI
jgi:hypothetical protein